MDPPGKIRLALFVMLLTFSKVVAFNDRDCTEDEGNELADRDVDVDVGGAA